MNSQPSEFLRPYFTDSRDKLQKENEYPDVVSLPAKLSALVIHGCGAKGERVWSGWSRDHSSSERCLRFVATAMEGGHDHGPGRVRGECQEQQSQKEEEGTALGQHEILISGH